MNLSRRTLPSLSSLRALEALDRLGSASAVAKELDLTQSAISRQLQTLEAQMGVQMVLRHEKRLSLTPEARAFAGEAREALGRLGQAVVRLQSGPVGGTLTLAILPTFGMRWLMPKLPDFSRRHPNVTLNMSTRMTMFDFAREPFDAAIHFGQPDWPGSDHLLLKHETLVPVAAPGLLAGATLRGPRDLLKLPLLHIQTRPGAWAEWFDRHGLPQTQAIPGMIHDQFSTIIQAALHGLGVGLLPDYLIEEERATGQLEVAWGAPIEARGSYYLVWPNRRTHDPALRDFRQWLAEQAEPEDPLPR
ncbi:MAG: LysR family transcriptional regulator [Marinibacterium sp.]|nr:LysR family transcriptional regulator [Marinibacterium sp.]